MNKNKSNLQRNLIIFSVSIFVTTSVYFAFIKKDNNPDIKNSSGAEYGSSDVEIGREYKNIQAVPTNNIITNSNNNSANNGNVTNNISVYQSEQERLNSLQPKQENLDSINQESEKYKEHISVEDQKGETPILAPEMH